MSPTLAELIEALPQEPELAGDAARSAPLEFARSVTEPSVLADRLSMRPVPVGRLRRMTLLGSLQAKIAAAYLFYWFRGWFKSAGENERLLTEAHWRTALRVLDSMSYLRGAVMKVGQTLANLPVAPREFIETLEKLHYDAPPMHWSLLREMVFNELGDDPENLFAEFDKTAFAAASPGQVHRARLKSGEEVAVKIQYPGIARTIREDFRNLMMFLFPARLGKDWESTQDQCDDLRIQLEHETDYVREADCLEQARSAFREEDRIAVPRVYPQYSTERVLTMEYLRGVHLDGYLARNPSQAERDDFGTRIVRASCRLLYGNRLFYADLHPGNLVFMDDGRLGLLDFGFVRQYPDSEWEWLRDSDRAITTGETAELRKAMLTWCGVTDPEAERERLEFTMEYARTIWQPRICGVEFDFADAGHFQKTCDLFSEMVRRRYSRAQRSTISIARADFGCRSILYRLKSRVDVRKVTEEEIVATGWDRSAYVRRLI